MAGPTSTVAFRVPKTESKTSSETQGVSIEDLYDVPLEEIARQLADWSRLGRQVEAVPEQVDQGNEASKTSAALEPDQMTFRWGARAANSALVAAVSVSLILISTLELVAVLWFFFVAWPGLMADPNRVLWLSGIALGAPACNEPTVHETKPEPTAERLRVREEPLRPLPERASS